MKKALSIASLGILLTISQAAPVFAANIPISMATPATAAPAEFKTTDQTSSSIGLSWSPVTNAPQYRIQVSKNADLSNSVWLRSIKDNPNIDVRDLSPGTAYYFKVRVINPDGSSVGPYGPVLKVSTKAQPAALPAIANPLKVSSFNVRCANCSGDEPDYLPWDKRRDTVVAQIKSKMPDVIGLQETSQAWLKDANGKSINLSQFEDLKNRLNTAGASYEVTNPNRNNCVDSTRPTNCVYADKGASLGTKIFYNKNTVTLVSQGSSALPKLATDSGPRYMSWASFKQNSTGKNFFVANAHLTPGSGAEYYDLRKQQALKVTQVINEKNTSSLPVLITGDMNSSKWSTPDNAPYDTYVKAGYVDPVGGTAFTSLASGYATAEKMINTKYGSYNGFKRQLTAPAGASARYLGSHIDYIFTSKMRVGAFEEVLNVDANGLLQGVIPSDHNMLMTTVELPALSAISTKALALNGSLGLAVDKEVYMTDGGGYQRYEKGFILWHPRTGAFENKNAIRAKWASAGYQKGWMGYPKTDEVASVNGGIYQVYEKGVIYWTGTTGAHISFGGIREIYGSLGYEKGRLGYPTTDEYVTASGVSQDYQGGRINWSPTGANSVTLK